MRKVILIILIICEAFSAKSFPQTQLTRDLSSFSPIKSPNQQIIEQVVNSGVFIVEQSYELADSLDNRYGWAGNRAFATDYSIAIKIKDGYILTDKTVHPWDYNPLYDQYRKDYLPKLFPTRYSEISKVCKYDTISYDKLKLVELFSGLIYAQETEKFLGEGFTLGGNVGENNGWIVWFTKEKKGKLSSSTLLNYSIIQKKLTISQRESESYFYPIDSLATSDSILGGIFIIPEIVGIGHLEFKLCGIVCKVENGWMLCCPFIKNRTIFKKDPDAIQVEEASLDLGRSALTLNDKKEEVSDKSKKSKKSKKTKKIKNK
jgi:hypothetical protein